MARHFLATAHMPTFAPLGGVECAVCVPLGGVEWHAGRSSLCLESRTVLACAHQKPQRAFCRILEPCGHPITIESVVWASRHATHSAPAPPCATRHKEEKVCPTTFWPSSEAPTSYCSLLTNILRMFSFSPGGVIKNLVTVRYSSAISCPSVIQYVS